MIYKLELSAPQYAFLIARSARNLFYSGQGGGKTQVLGVMTLNLLQEVPGSIGLICANTYSQLSNSTLFRVFDVWKKHGITEYDKNNNPHGDYVVDKAPPPTFKDHGHTFKSNQNKIYLKSGAVCMTASLDNFKALDGTTIGWCALDETKDTKEIAVKEVITGRLRQTGLYLNKEFKPLGNKFQFTDDIKLSAGEVNPLFIFSSPAKTEWMNEMFDLEKYQNEITASIYSKTDYFHKRFDNKTVVICSAYHNEKFLPSNYISDRIKEMSPDLVNALIYGDPFSKTGGEYYANFKLSTHVKRVDYTPGLPLHLSFDFNVNPYMTGTVWQVVPGVSTKVRCISEYALAYPRNTIEDTCMKFLGEYGHLCDPGFFFYGDASGKNTQPLKEQRNHYEVIEKVLRQIVSGSSKRLLKSNPRHQAIMAGTLGRRDFMNGCLNSRYGFDIEIDENCKHLIADLQYLKEDANGAKEKLKTEVNGVKCEKYGHHSDTMDYFMCYNWGEYRK